MATFPTLRPRRLRSKKLLRDLVAESQIRKDGLILPVFIKDGIDNPEEIKTMPEVYRYPVNDKLINYIEESLKNGINKFILFGVPKIKDDLATSAMDSDGIIQKTLKLIKNTFGGKVLLITDECTDEYTSHGHCGIVTINGSSYKVDNDESIKLHAKIALSQAKAGADVIAPSSMMDGVVGEIRKTLDENGFQDVPIMAYSSKYASTFYGPFREAAYSKPAFGDRRGYQMDPRNLEEGVREVYLDIEEGADIVMVKPAHTYLDVITRVKQSFPCYPLAAYHVSGEYSMLKAAAINGWIDEKRAVLEVTNAIFRAGADIVITYYANKIIEWLNEGDPF
jgi:porphobilinogen synthase